MELLERILHAFLLFVAAMALLKLGFAILVAFLAVLVKPSLVGSVLADLRCIRERDPAVEGWIAALFYPGWWALTLHKLIAHPLYRIGLRTPARLANFGSRFLTGTDIHPGAQLGQAIFIDHAHGVVIGETAIVGDGVTILHQVTLGGTGKEHGKRHPTVEDGVLLSAGSKVLGNIVIGADAKIGAGSVVVKAVPAESTVVGIPGRIVATGGKRLPAKSLDQTDLPDPIVERLVALQDELREWERKVEERKSSGARWPKAGEDVLAEIVAHKHTEVAEARSRVPLADLRGQTGQRGTPRGFADALRGPGLRLIAEIKKASPSGGLLREDFDPKSIARIYQDAHASALSVLTDQKYFQGSLEYLAQVRDTVGLPLLRKDFVIDEYQIVEAARAGADAVLLIAACLDDAQLKGFREAASAEGLDALVEVHDEAELVRALQSGAKILGINNRNLKTLETKLETTFRLVRELPSDRNGLLVVSESGIRTAEDTHRLIEAGVHAVLIGETFMRAPDIGSKVREIMGHGEYAI